MKPTSLRIAALATLVTAATAVALLGRDDAPATPAVSTGRDAPAAAPARAVAPTRTAASVREVALPSLPTRDLTPGTRRVYTLSSSRTLTMTTGGAAGTGRESRYGLSGHLSFVVADVDDDLVHVVARLEDARAVGLASTGPAHEALVLPFVVSLEPSGRIAALHFAAGTPAATANLLTSTVASLQLVAPDDARAARWSALESDAAGEYRAAYTREASAPLRVVKSREAYVRLVTLEGLRPSEEVADYDVRSREVMDVGQDGWPSRLEASEHVAASTPGAAAIDVASQATTTAELVLADRVAVDHDAFQAAWEGLVTRESARATTFSDVRATIDRDKVAGASFGALHGDLGRALTDGGLRSKAYPQVAARMGALLRLDPAAVADAGRAVRAAGSFEEAAALVAALGDAGTSTARAELATLMGDEAVEVDRRAAAAVYLGNARQVDADTVKTLVAAATGPEAAVDADVREAALLGAGSAVNRANAQGDVATADAMTALLEGFAAAQTPAERMAYLEALGNSGDARALPAIQSALGAPEVEVVATAVMALRLMPTSVDPVLCVALSHPHPLVRGAALTALEHRAVLPFEAALLERVEREPESALRAAAVRLLQTLVPSSPELATVLAEIAAKDPDANVREVAATRAEAVEE